MCKQYTPYFSVARLIFCSGFGDSFGGVEDYARDNIQEVISLGRVLMCNYASVCGGMVGFKILMRDSY